MDEKRNRDVIIVIVSVIVIILVAYFFIGPTVTTLKESNYTIATKGQDLKLAQENLDNLKSLQSSLNVKTNEVKALISALPAYVDEEDLMTSLEAMASKEGMQLTGITPTSGTGATEETGAVEETITEQVKQEISLGEVALDINLKGSYQGLQKFVADLENNRRPINVTKISVAKEGATGAASILNVTISLTTYYSQISS
ncbi:MAG: type 4a pilus biogenesis protein PilO [Candidatus Berkelbacteria bacterium]|nr:type 4a pilus biogenesis protein PilO [Candidatus Berkelbacteria bacterium]